MTITIEIIGYKKEIEDYFKGKIFSKGWNSNVEKKMSKQMKSDIDLIGMSSESSICFNSETKYKLSLARYGACELPKKQIKKRKSTKNK